MKIELTEKETEILCEYLDDFVDNDDLTDQEGVGDYIEKLDVLKSIRKKMVLHNYYFTFGSDPKFPFYKGYLIVKAESINVACDKFEKNIQDVCHIRSIVPHITQKNNGKISNMIWAFVMK